MKPSYNLKKRALRDIILCHQAARGNVPRATNFVFYPKLDVSCSNGCLPKVHVHVMLILFSGRASNLALKIGLFGFMARVRGEASSPGIREDLVETLMRTFDESSWTERRLKIPWIGAHTIIEGVTSSVKYRVRKSIARGRGIDFALAQKVKREEDSRATNSERQQLAQGNRELFQPTRGLTQMPYLHHQIHPPSSPSPMFSMKLYHRSGGPRQLQLGVKLPLRQHYLRLQQDVVPYCH